MSDKVTYRAVWGQLKKLIAKVRSFAKDLVRGLSSCLGQVASCRNPSQNSCLLPASTSCLTSSSAPDCHSQLLCVVKTKLAVQFSRQLLRRTTVNHLVSGHQHSVCQDHPNNHEALFSLPYSLIIIISIRLVP